MATLRKQGDSILLGKLENVNKDDFFIKSRLSIIKNWVDDIIKGKIDCHWFFHMINIGFYEFIKHNKEFEDTIYHIEFNKLTKEILIYEVTEDKCWVEN